MSFQLNFEVSRMLLRELFRARKEGLQLLQRGDLEEALIENF